MIDQKIIIENPTLIAEKLAKKGCHVDFTPFLNMVERRKQLLLKVEAAKAERNKLSASVPQVKKAGGDVNAIFAHVKEIMNEVAKDEEELAKLEEEIKTFLMPLPNIPDDDLLPGGKENNKTIYEYGEPQKFNFKPKNHVELCESCGLIDYERAAKMSGHGTWVYTGLGAQLEWALLNFFISEHLKDGYTFMLPPHILNYESGFVAGQFPKFIDDVFSLEGVSPKKFILPTAETALVNFHRDEILSEDELPKKYFAYTPCYRKEAGAYRTEERGMIRGYQFNKIEMFQYTTEEGDMPAFEELVRKACSLVQKLGLTFRVSKLAAEDISASMARTYDIEIYIPSVGIFKEVSSVSTAHDYQARRGMIRYRDKKTNKVKFAHTLNGSGLATSRIFPALVEQMQQEDGSIKIPEVLRPYMGGLEYIKPIKK
ncbi:MAG: serine--tRNA ligase [Erysipelotrichaceae bacterium]|nr:serine--tRNA ligase [Erysipelotrichaceae bacterium]